MAVTGHTLGFTSGTTSGIPVLFCLTVVPGLTGALVYHDVRQDGVKRPDRETMPAHGTSGRQGHDMELSMLMSIGLVGHT